MTHMPGCSPALRTAHLPGTRPLTCCFVKEVGQEAAHHSLVANDQHVLLSLQFHDHGLQSLYQVFIGLKGKWGRVEGVSFRPGSRVGMESEVFFCLVLSYVNLAHKLGSVVMVIHQSHRNPTEAGVLSRGCLRLLEVVLKLPSA